MTMTTEADRQLVVECSQCGWSPFDEAPGTLAGEKCSKCNSSAWVWRGKVTHKRVVAEIAAGALKVEPRVE